jgi:hypothetical protein
MPKSDLGVRAASFISQFCASGGDPELTDGSSGPVDPANALVTALHTSDVTANGDSD